MELHVVSTRPQPSVQFYQVGCVKSGTNKENAMGVASGSGESLEDVEVDGEGNEQRMEGGVSFEHTSTGNCVVQALHVNLTPGTRIQLAEVYRTELVARDFQQHTYLDRRKEV